MTEQQQKLYEKLLKKVNEYCLGAAAEDVIAAIDELVENYEKPKKRITKTKDQLLVENECYQYMLHTVKCYVESEEFSLEDLAKKLKAVEVIKNKGISTCSVAINYDDFDRYSKSCFRRYNPLSLEEYNLLKEVFNNESTN